MKFVNLGNDKIPSIAIGTWSWGSEINGGNRIFGNSYNQNDLEPVYQYAVKNGFTLWDTAAVYGMGASETILGDCMKKSDNIILSTKFTPLGIQLKGAMEKSLEKSKQRLKINNVDIYWIHNPSNIEKWTLQAAKLYKKGYIKHIGISNHNLEQAKKAFNILKEQGIHLSAIQNHYSLIYRTSEEEGLLKWCEENDVKFFSYMVLEQGSLTGKFNSENTFKSGTRRAKAFPPETLKKLEPLTKAMKNVGERYGADLAQIAIAWAMAKGTVPIIGATKISNVESLIKVDSIALEREEIEYLEETAKKTGVSVKAGWE